MRDRGHFMTELSNTRSAAIDRMTVAECFDVMNGEDAGIAAAVAAEKDHIVRAIELVVKAFKAGGRLIYVGAGTSGRLGVVDASECPPTFMTPPEMVQGDIAGGYGAMFKAVEGAEDSEDAGADAMKSRQVGPNDVVFGIATGGSTPYVHGAIRYAKSVGAGTVFFACVPADHFPDDADVSIRVLTGPEVITGSTRLKAGTATKLTLNMVTTIAMVRIGKVYGNLMVDLNAYSNTKLVDRSCRIIAKVTGADRDRARQLLDDANGRVKVAIVMQMRDTDRATAEQLLDAHEGNVRRVLES